MKSKKGLLGTLITVVLIIVVFMILASTFSRMFKSAKDSVIDLVDKEQKEFNIVAGSLINPSMNAEFTNTFWHSGVIDMIKGAAHFKEGTEASGQQYDFTSCLGSFYVDGTLDSLQSSNLNFKQDPDKGIMIYFRDSDNVAGAINEQVLADTESQKWELCMIDLYNDDSKDFQSYLLDKIKNGAPLSYVDKKSFVQPIDSIEITFRDNNLRKDWAIQAEYFTKKSTEISEDSEPKSIWMDYQSYEITSSRTGQATIGDGGGIVDRFLFLFVILKETKEDKTIINHFCLVPTKRKSNSELKGISLETLNPELRKVLPNNKDFNNLKNLNNNKLKTLCDITQFEASVFKETKACYYFGCDDMAELSRGPVGLLSPSGDTNPATFCSAYARQCPGLCTPHETAWPFKDNVCDSCRKIAGCNDDIPNPWDDSIEMAAEFCKKDYCNNGCVLNYGENNCKRIEEE